MKKVSASVLLAAGLLLAGCAANAAGGTSEITYSYEKDGCTLSFSLPFSPCGEQDGYYDLDVNDDNVTYSDENGAVLQHFSYTHPLVAGKEHAAVYSTDFTFEILRFDSGELLAVEAPVKELKDSPEDCRALTLYTFDESMINFIGTDEYGGNFFPVISGDITVDGDTFSYIDVQDGQKTVSYAVDFEKKMLVPV